jgi:TPR repeat protein
MKTLIVSAAIALAAAAPAWQVAYAQAQATAAQTHVNGLALERRGDDSGAFSAFVEAADAGYPPAQAKLGEIYDSGNAVVARNYEESIRWYQKARENGAILPAPKSPMPSVTIRP